MRLLRVVRRAHLLVLALELSGGCGQLGAQTDNLKGLNILPGFYVENAETVQRLGMGTVRMEVPWEMVEPSRGQFDWTKLDEAVKTASAHHVEVLLTLRSVSGWGTKAGAGTQAANGENARRVGSAPMAMADWVEFVGALAARYAGRGVDYEIENEVNGVFWAGTLQEYLELLKASYAAIKAKDTKAVVLGSAMACGIAIDFKTPALEQAFRDKGDDWLRAILGTKALDAVNVHDYYLPGEAAVNGWTFTTYLKHTTEVMDMEGMGETPIWMTEVGYVSQPTKAGKRTDGGSPEEQAKWLVDAFGEGEKMGVKRMFWDELKDAKAGGYFSSMGLMDEDGQARPALKAFENLGKK